MYLWKMMHDIDNLIYLEYLFNRLLKYKIYKFMKMIFK